MAERWEPGDEAMCISGGGWSRNGKPVSGPALYSTSKVRMVGWNRQNVTGLWLEGWSPTDKMKDGFDARAFVKVKPQAEQQHRRTEVPETV